MNRLTRLRRSWPVLGALVAPMIACAGVQDSGLDCGMSGSVGTIYCYRQEGQQWLLCLTHPYQITVAPPIMECVTGLQQGQEGCNEQGDTIYPETYTYSCFGCDAVTTDPVLGEPCQSASLYGLQCP